MSSFTDELFFHVTDEWRSEKASEIFESDLWPGGILVVRNWHVGFDDPTLGKRQSKHKILLRQGLNTGVWIVIVDGIPVKNGFAAGNNRQFNIEFTIENKTAVIECDGTTSARYAHKLTIDGCVYTDLRDIVTEAVEEDIPASVVITNTRTETDKLSKRFVCYQLFVKTAGGQYTSVERRFSQFDCLNSSIRSGLRSHLADSLPTMPSKVVAPWVDQGSADFTRERQKQLEVYINHLLGNSKLTHTTDLMCFLGLHPLTGVPFEPMSAAAADLLNQAFR